MKKICSVLFTVVFLFFFVSFFSQKVLATNSYPTNLSTLPLCNNTASLVHLYWIGNDVATSYILELNDNPNTAVTIYPTDSFSNTGSNHYRYFYNPSCTTHQSSCDLPYSQVNNSWSVAACTSSECFKSIGSFATCDCTTGTCAALQPGTPNAPTNLTAEPLCQDGASGATLSWDQVTDSAGNYADHYILSGDSANPIYGFSPRVRITKIISNLSCNSSTSWSVQACNASGQCSTPATNGPSFTIADPATCSSTGTVTVCSNTDNPSTTCDSSNCAWGCPDAGSNVCDKYPAHCVNNVCVLETNLSPIAVNTSACTGLGANKTAVCPLAQAAQTPTTISLVVGLDGVGITGDQIDKTPLDPTKAADAKLIVTPVASRTTENVTIEVDSGGTKKGLGNGTITYQDTGTDKYFFKGTITLDSAIAAGNYDVKVTVEEHLSNTIKNVAITTAGPNTVTINNVEAGDVAGSTGTGTTPDNQLNPTDYTALLSCMPQFKFDNAISCSTTLQHNDDLNLDGKIDQADYNLWLREYSSARIQGD